MKIELRTIGKVESSRIKVEDDFWGDVLSQIVLDHSLYSSEAIDGLTDFSHIEFIYHFHLVPQADEIHGSNHPRGNTTWPKVGIFAQRKKDRPNRIGTSICELVKMDGTTITVRGLDAIHGTPVLDIKPCVREFLPDRQILRQPHWMTELMKNYFAKSK